MTTRRGFVALMAAFFGGAWTGSGQADDLDSLYAEQEALAARIAAAETPEIERAQIEAIGRMPLQFCPDGQGYHDFFYLPINWRGGARLTRVDRIQIASLRRKAGRG